MIKYISEILDAKGNDMVALKYLVFLAMIVFIYLLYKYTEIPSKRANNFEGFSQDKPFVLKMDEQIYDEFYVEVYDELHATDKRSTWLIEQVVKMTEPTKQSIMLDVGCGTCKVIHKLKQMGYSVYGVDKSKKMVDYVENLYPDIEVQHCDVMDPMAFERSSFTHILCTGFTIYEIPDKKTLFRNLYHWLKPNAYLIIHLAEPDKFSAVSPTKDAIQWMPFFKTEKPRTTDSVSEFDDFQYKQSIHSSPSTNITKITETFTDKETNQIRQNEQALIMEPIDSILTLASREGFILHGKVDMSECNGDKHQYLYILERLM
jgi:SAM-dependent methyltransferase